MVTDLWCGEMLPEIHTTEKCAFLKLIIHSKIILFTVDYFMLIHSTLTTIVNISIF